MKSMRAKLTIQSVTSVIGHTQILKLQAQYDADNTPEDNTYSKFTPNAVLEMTISNPELVGTFAPGGKYYVDFTPIQPEPAKG